MQWQACYQQKQWQFAFHPWLPEHFISGKTTHRALSSLGAKWRTNSKQAMVTSRNCSQPITSTHLSLKSILNSCRFSVKLTWMEIKCNWAAFLDSPIFIRLNCPNSDSRTSHFVGLWRFYYCFTDASFPMIACGEKSPVHHMMIVTRLGHDKYWLQGPALFVGKSICGS